MIAAFRLTPFFIDSCGFHSHSRRSRSFAAKPISVNQRQIGFPNHGNTGNHGNIGNSLIRVIRVHSWPSHLRKSA
jgi:hypothetical protein